MDDTHEDVARRSTVTQALAVLATAGAVLATLAVGGPARALGECQATVGGGVLSVQTTEYSIDTALVKVDYSGMYFPGVLIDIDAVDTSTGAVASTARIDSNSWVFERVLDHLVLGHTYRFTARMSWADGSNPVVVSAPAERTMVFTDTLRTMTFETLIGPNLCATLQDGTVYPARIKYASETDPRTFGRPIMPSLRVSSHTSTSRSYSWTAAGQGAGFPLKGYRIVVTRDGHPLSSRAVALSEPRRFTVQHLRKGHFYVVELQVESISGNVTSTVRSSFH